MTISWPTTLPVATRGAAEIVITPNVAGGVSSSPFTGEQQVYMHPGEWWMIELRLGAMNRADAEEWLGALLGLNGPEGTFLAGDPLGAAPRGTWTGSPLVNGASQTGKTLAIDGMAAGATGKRGDWFQLGSGSSTRLHKLTADFTANGSGEATIDFWPRLRASPANNDPLTIANALGIWRLATRGVPWTLRDVQIGGIVIPGMEVL